MGNIAKIIGQRIRNYRTELGLSQEKLVDIAGCHATYIGQLERGEKNATIESIERISIALKIPLSKLFENLGGNKDYSRNIPLKCYELLSSKSISEQAQLYRILMEIDKYKSH